MNTETIDTLQILYGEYYTRTAKQGKVKIKKSKTPWITKQTTTKTQERNTHQIAKR